MSTQARSVEDLRPYVPELLSRWSPSHGDPRHMRVEGSLVFVDISGFTKLTERLARKGKVGAEEMSDLLSSTFAALLDVSRLERADLLKWGGDAVLLLFRGGDHAARAGRAACDMRTTLRTAGRLETTEGSVTLRMSVGIHSGEFDCYLVGDPHVHQELLVVGPGVTTTAVMEQAAVAGQVVVSPETAALLPPGSCREGPEPGTRLLHARRLLGPAGTIERRQSRSPRADAAVLAGFIPPVLRQQLLATPGEPEHRTVAVAFVKFSGTDELTERAGVGAVADALDQCVRTVQRATDDHGVTFFETDIDRDGGKIMLVAGAPRSNGHDEERMLRTTRQIMDGMAGLEEMTGHALALRIGVNRGNVFAGGFGPDFRRTFSIKGDAVNLAARVMGKAGLGELLATSAALERSPTQFDVEPLPPFLVKGKSMPIHASKVGAVRGLRRDRRAETPYVGRESELDELQAALDSARFGSGRQVEVVGEPGIGKSRLVEQALALDGRTDGALVVHFAACGEYESTTAYYPFRRLLREVLGLDRDASAEDTSRRLAEVVTAAAPRLGVWLPLLGIPLGLDLPDTRETRELDEQFRKGRLEDVVDELLSAVIGQPTVLRIEDVHLMDDASADLVDRLTRDITQRPWVLLMTRREFPVAYVPRAGEHLVTVRPGPLASEAALELVQAATGDRALTRDALEALATRGGGNPMFLEALSTAAGREGTVEGLPESVEGLVTSQIDRLDPVDRTVLRYAAVLGFVVRDLELQDLLTAQFGTGSESDLGQRLPLLDEFLTRSSPGRLRFRNALMRDVAYEGLPYRRRQVLHDQVGRRLEAGSADPREQSELLSLHFFQAGRFERAWRYSRVAGMRARSKYANTEAVAFFTRAAESARRVPDDVPPHELAEVLESLGDVRFLVGAAPGAWTSYRQARRLLADDAVRVAEITLKEARIEQRHGKYALALRRLSRGLSMLGAANGQRAAAARSLLACRYAICRVSQGRYADALRWGEIAVREAQDSSDKAALGQAYLAMQTIHMWSGRAEDLPYGQLALHVYEELGELAGQAQSLNNLAVRATFEGRWNECLSMFERAADNFQRLGDVMNIANTAYNIADILMRQGRVTEADPLLQQALTAAMTVEDEELVALVLRERGKAWSRAGRFEEGRASLEDAKVRLEALGAPAEVVDADAAIAEGLMLQGAFEAAIVLAHQCVDAANQAGARMVLPTLHRMLGFSFLSLGRYPEARADFDRALELSAGDDMQHERGFVLLGLAHLASAEGDPKARQLARDSSAALDRLGVVSAPVPGGVTIDVRIPAQTTTDITLPA